METYVSVEDPVNMHTDKKIQKADKKIHTGFIAQEIEKAAEETGFNFDAVHIPKNNTDPYSLSYGAFVVPLVKVVQEQQAIIEKQIN